MQKPLYKIIYKNPLEIRINKKFSDAFNMDKQTLSNLTASIKTNGYDKEHPLVLWDKSGELIDGHTRRQASINAGLIRVPVIYKQFETESEVLSYINRNQIDRRNLTDAEKINLIINNPEFIKAKRKTDVVKNILHCSERTASKYLSIINNPARLKAVLTDGQKVTAVTVKADTRPAIIRTAERLQQLIEKSEQLTQDEITALDNLFTTGRRYLRKVKSA